MDNRCVCCGEIIPEGRQVCPNCNASVGTHTVDSCESKNAKDIRKNCVTNYDRIRNMSVDELATLLGYSSCNVCPAKQFCDSTYAIKYKNCNDVLKHWLENEVTEE